MTTIHVYPARNYSSVTSDALPSRETYRDSALSRRDDWLKIGTRRTLHLTLLAHEDGIPCALLLRSAQGFGLLEGVRDPIQAEEESIKQILVKHLMKHSASDRFEFSINDCLLQLWRPEFDDNLYPYLPAHVSRPKEQLRAVLVGLPPRCVVQVPKGTSLEFVSLHEIRRGGVHVFGPLVGALPELLSRTTLKFLVPQV